MSSMSHGPDDCPTAITGVPAGTTPNGTAGGALGASASVDEVQPTQPNSVQSSSGVSPLKDKSRQVTFDQVVSSVRRVQKEDIEDGESEAFVGYGQILDVIELVTGLGRSTCRATWTRMQDASKGGPRIAPPHKFERFAFSELRSHITTPIASLETLVKIIMVVPGNCRMAFRIHCAEMLVRVFAGKPGMHVTVDRNGMVTRAENRHDAAPPQDKIAHFAGNCEASTAAVADFKTANDQDTEVAASAPVETVSVNDTDAGASTPSAAESGTADAEEAEVCAHVAADRGAADNGEAEVPMPSAATTPFVTSSVAAAPSATSDDLDATHDSADYPKDGGGDRPDTNDDDDDATADGASTSRVRISLDIWALDGHDLFSVKALFDATPPERRTRSGNSGWANARTLAKQVLGCEYKVISGDITPPISHLDKVVNVLVKGGSQALIVKTRKLTPTPVPSHPTPADGASANVGTQGMNCRQVFDSIRRVRSGDLKGFGSVIDLIKLVTGQSADNASKTLRRLVGTLNSDLPVFRTDSPEHKFWGDLPKSSDFGCSGQQLTPVAPFKELVKLIPYIRSRSADSFKAEIANDFVRKVAGDQTLHAEIDANNATFTHEEREDLVQGIPNASAESVFIHKQVERFANRSELGPVTILTPPWIPCEILKAPGGYLGVLGEETHNGVRGARLKSGEAQVIEKRWSAKPGGHLATAKHGMLLWAAATKSRLCTGHDIQERVKSFMQSDWCKRQGVKVIAQTSNEEYWCPLDSVKAVYQRCTEMVEEGLGDDVTGCHNIWNSRTNESTKCIDPDDTSTSAVERDATKLELSRQETRREQIRLEREEVKAREASKQEKERTRREVMCAMIQKGYSIADIQLLTNSD